MKKFAAELARIAQRRLHGIKRRCGLAGGNYGFCVICERRVFFEIHGPALRDQYVCNRCNSIPRWRALILVLNEMFPDWRKLFLHESSPGGPASEKLAKECEHYLGSHFFPGEPLGKTVRGFRCEDLAAQTFPDDSFDLVVTSDVFEHLMHPREAIREIARTLKPGGAHVFTVPWYHWKPTLVRASENAGQILHREPPDYHGNPISSEGSLVVTEWGTELPFLLSEWSGMSTTVIRHLDPHYGLAGDFPEVFLCKKPLSASATTLSDTTGV